jgi:hypothetical protein
MKLKLPSKESKKKDTGSLLFYDFTEKPVVRKKLKEHQLINPTQFAFRVPKKPMLIYFKMKHNRDTFMKMFRIKPEIKRCLNALHSDDTEELPPTLVHGHRSFARLTWDSLRLYGSRSQLAQFSSFRWNYINYLLQEAKKKVPHGVSFDIVGTNSPISDIDISLYSARMALLVADLRNKKYSNNLNQLVKESTSVSQFIAEVHGLHKKYFTESLETMFDTNLYGGIVITPSLSLKSPPLTCHCSPTYDNVDSAQRVWAFTRLVHAIRQCRRCETVMRREVSSTKWMATLVGRAETLLGMWQDNNRNVTYGDALIDYYKRVQEFMQPTSGPDVYERMYNAFSHVTQYQNESYHTISTLMHIVYNHGDILSENSLFDSVIENMSFIVEILVTHVDACGDVYAKLPKCAKYLERITDAMILMSTRLGRKISPTVRKMYDVAREINQSRKDMTYNPEQGMELLKMLNTPGIDGEMMAAAIVKWVTRNVPYVPPLKKTFDFKKALNA